MFQLVCKKTNLQMKYLPKLRLAKNLMEFLEVSFKNEDIRTFFRMTTHTPNPLFLWVVFANMLQVSAMESTTTLQRLTHLMFFFPQQKKKSGCGV